VKRVSLKIVLLLLISVFTISILIGCSQGVNDNSTEGSSTSSSKKVESSKSKGLIDNLDDFKKMYSEPDKFKNYNIEFPARIFLEPEVDDTNTYFQCYAYNNDNLNMVVSANGVLDLEDGDIVNIKGTVKGLFESENAFGAKLSLAAVMADFVEKTDYATAFSPAIKVTELNKEIDQHGYLMRINKVEFAEEETRVYLTIENNTDDNITFYSFNAKAVQGSTQLKEGDSYGKGYDEIESEILPGVKEQGIIVFQKCNLDEPLKIYLEGSSNNYDLDFETFIFEIE